MKLMIWYRTAEMWKRALICAAAMVVLCGLLLSVLVLVVSVCMKDVTEDRIYTVEDFPAGDYDCILVLGAGVREDGTASPMLADRVKIACELYEKLGDVPLLMSGDHTGDYNEVSVMKALAMESGVPGEDIFLDHKGYSTYESICRAKEKFGAKRIIVVSQGYHLYRALHIADSIGLEACGSPSDLRDYYLQTRYELREMLARFKDLFAAAARIPVGDIGSKVDLSGDGNLT